MLDVLIARIAKEPARRAALVREHAALVGAPPSRIQRQLRAAGHGSGRRRRADAGATQVSDEVLDEVASLMVGGVRKTGQATMPLGVACSIVRARGAELPVSDTRVGQLLRERRLDLATQRRGKRTHADVVSGGPNHLHLVDPSVPLFYYDPGKGQRRLDESGFEPYRNKPDHLADKVHLRIWRYVMVDHWSASIRVRYYRAPGEAPDVLWDFLLYCWSARHAERGQWHGVPEHLWWDKGSDHRAIRTACEALGVAPWAHMAGNPNAVGSVEKAQQIVEQHFESRLRLQPAADLDEINRLVERWCDLYNTNGVAGVDTRLTRNSVRSVRSELWARVSGLRELPEDARDAAVYEPVTRRVKPNLTFTFSHPRLKESRPYLVARLPGVEVGTELTVQPLLLADVPGTVRVTHVLDGEELTELVTPRELDVSGMPLDGSRIDGDVKSHPLTASERSGERLRAIAGDPRPGEASHGGRYRATDAIAGERKILQMPRRGEPAAPKAEPAAATLTLADTLRRARRLLGDRWDPALIEVVSARWPRGAAEAELDRWAAELASGEATG